MPEGRTDLTAASAQPAWPVHGGEMARLIRAHDWAATPLGAAKTWPDSLKAVADLLLAGGFPMVALWGPNLVQIYNDGYRAIMGEKHPAGLGQPTRECWPEVWHINAPIYERIRAGETLTFRDKLYPITRHRALEDAWFTLSYSPLRDEEGAVAGVLVTVVETTDRVLAEAALRESEARAAEDSAGMRRLHDLHTKLASETDLHAALSEILAAAAEFTRTDRGCVQLVSEDGERLEMFAVRGYGPGSPFVEHFMHEGSKAACEAARRDRARLIIEDVETFPPLANTIDREVALADGIRATQSTPMVSRKGELVGVLSTQFREPHRASDHELRLIDLLAWTAAEFVTRHQADAALRESEARYRALVTAGSYLIYRMSPDWQRMHQLDGREFLADTSEPTENWPDAYILPEDRPAVFAAIADAIRGGSLFELEHRVRRADGSVGWVLSRAVPILGPEGEIIEWFGAGSDVTERRVAQEQLRESEERFRGFAENSADVLWIADRSGERLEYLSPAFEHTFGEPRDRIMANLGRWRELVHPDDRAGAAEFMPRAASGEVAIAHYRVVRPVDGTVRCLRDTGFPIRGADGAIARVAGIVQDITDIELATAALRAEKERFRILVEGMPQLVWRSRDAGLWSWASPQWLDYTGLGQEESQGWGWLNAVHPDDRDAARQAWDEAPSRGRLDVEYRVQRASDGAWRWHATRSVPVRGSPEPGLPNGRILEWLGTTTDIEDQAHARAVLATTRDELEALVEVRTAELMAAEASLRQSQKLEAVGQLTGGIAHDFNNMLQGVMGSLELMRRRAEQGRTAEAARYVESARRTVQRAAALTHRLLAFARQLPLDPAPVNLDRLTAGMEELIRRAVGPAVQVELRLGNGTWPVLCDENQMENALLNLCVNARDAMPDGGWLTIATAEAQLSAADLAGEEGVAPGAYAVISVTDTGAGMAPEVVARAFEPFFTTKPIGQGTGLGLSQIYGFVRQSGGVARIESAPGEGTTVRLFLPRHEPAPAEDTQDGDKMTDVVLLVEDEEMLRQAAAEWLREAGHRVLEAPDGAAALRLLHGAGRVDALVADVGLPGGMNGRQVADAARAHRPGLPVLFMTGYAATTLPQGAEVIRKPFTLDELAERVGGILEAARSGQGADASGGA